MPVCRLALWYHSKAINRKNKVIGTFVIPTTPTLILVEVVPFPVPNKPSINEPMPSTKIPGKNYTKTTARLEIEKSNSFLFYFTRLLPTHMLWQSITENRLPRIIILLHKIRKIENFDDNCESAKIYDYNKPTLLFPTTGYKLVTSSAPLTPEIASGVLQWVRITTRLRIIRILQWFK